MESAALVALRDSIAQEQEQDAGEVRLSMATLQVILASIGMCTDQSILEITNAAREDVTRPGGDWIADADNLDANYCGYWQQQQRVFDVDLTRSLHFMGEMERNKSKKK